MPIYEYICQKCGQCFEKLVFSSEKETSFTCPSCGHKKTERLMSSFSCTKGSGSGVSGIGTSAGCSPQGGFS